MDARWYVLRTQSRADQLVANDMVRDGFDVFSPRVKGIHPLWADVEMPLFPGYLFLRLNVEQDGLPLFPQSDRLIGWLKFGDDIAWVTDQVVNAIKDRSECINREGGLGRRFRSGELVRVASGAMQGNAKVMEDSKTAQSKVRVLLEFMGRSVITQIPGSDLQLVEDQPPANRQNIRRTRGKGRRIRRPDPIPLSV